MRLVFQSVKNISFAWENINIFEIVSTMTELTFVIENKNSIRGYEVLQKYLEHIANA
jgi:hypothetical protein